MSAYKTKIAVILPSRGLVFSQTVEELLRELKSVDCEWEIFWAHQKPIPDCFNIPTEKALRDKRKFTHFWFVEEDMGLPVGILQKYLDADTHAIASDYPVTSMPSGTILYDPDGNAYFTGTGSLLVKREMLEMLDKPIWRSDVAYELKYHPDHLEVKKVMRTKEQQAKVYGHQDIHFGFELYRRGYPIQVCKTNCWQRKLVKMGRQNSNMHGTHKIRQTKKVAKNDYMRISKEMVKRPEWEHLEEVWIDGELTNVKKDFAEKLIKEGRAKPYRTGHIAWIEK